MTELARVSPTRPRSNFITLVINFGRNPGCIETSPGAVARFGDCYTPGPNRVVRFVAEICSAGGRRQQALALLSRSIQRLRFFTVVVVTLLPFGGQYVTVLRLLRLLRVLRLVHACHASDLGERAAEETSLPWRTGRIPGPALLYAGRRVFCSARTIPNTLAPWPWPCDALYVVTLEGWAELMYTQMYAATLATDAAAGSCAGSRGIRSAPLYFVSSCCSLP